MALGQGELHQHLFLSNFPLNRSVGAILSAISYHTYNNVGAYPHYIGKEVEGDGIHIAVENTMQYEAIKDCNGLYVFNQRIWIIEYPEHYRIHAEVMSEIFEMYTCDGMVDLSNLSGKYAEVESLNAFKQPLKDGQARPTLSLEVNFGKPAFVEFLLFMLGSDARDKRFFVDTLVLSWNGITSVESLKPYMVFLPTLHCLVLTGNSIQDREEADIPGVKLVFDSPAAAVQPQPQQTNTLDPLDEWDVGTFSASPTASTAPAASVAPAAGRFTPTPARHVVRPAPDVPIRSSPLSRSEGQVFAQQIASAPVIM